MAEARAGLGAAYRTGRNLSVENLGKKFFHLAPDSVIGKSSAAAWKAAIEKSGGQVIQEEFAPLATQDFCMKVIFAETSRA